MNKQAARRYRISNPDEALRSEVVDAVCSISNVARSGVRFMDLETSWQFVNTAYHATANLKTALMSLEPPEDVACVHMTLPQTASNQLLAVLRSAGERAGDAEIVLEGDFAKRAGGLIAPARPVICNLSLLRERFARLGRIGIYMQDLQGGLDLSLQEWSHDPHLQDEGASYWLWHLFVWGTASEWLFDSAL